MQMTYPKAGKAYKNDQHSGIFTVIAMALTATFFI